MQERRNAPRRGTAHDLLIFDRSTGASLGRLTNVSPSGFMIQTTEPHDPMREFRCRVPLPAHVLLTEELLFDARSVWSRQVGESAQFQVGFEIIHVTPEERENIELVLREIATESYWT